MIKMRPAFFTAVHDEYRPRLLAALILLLSLSACATQKSVLNTPMADPLQACRVYIDRFDALTAQHHARDYQAPAIAGFPYLRVNRLLASLAPHADDEAKFAAWVHHLRDLDQDARRFEYANLPSAVQDALLQSAPLAAPVLETISECAGRLLRARLSDNTEKQALLAAATVPDSYRLLQRVAGLYPLSALVVRAAVSHWQDSVRAQFATAHPAAQGLWQVYLPPAPPSLSADEVAVMLRAARDPLDIPVLNAEQLTMLFNRYAPVWELDTVDDNDRPGQPFWGTSQAPQFDSSQALSYTHVSYTRFGGRILLQLNYIIWFAARPAEGPLDILSGALDGLYWRVTLDEDGRVLLYDSMHPCGCYHQFFPSAALRPKDERRLYQEPILIPQSAPPLAAAQRLRIRVSAGKHYLLQLLPDETPTAGIPYRFEPYDGLRSLPAPQGGRRSLFADKGLVPGTARGERWFLWPMGIASPGAMRQWGHHATAFVGRRHFDEPFLIERNFSATTPSN